MSTEARSTGSTHEQLDRPKVDAFWSKALDDAGGAMVTLLAGIGDRLGLFKNLAVWGAATSAELASRTRLNERYVREWLGAMASAGYLHYDPASRRFRLPPEHAPALAHENGPHFLGGVYQMFPALVTHLRLICQSFRHGGGVPPSAYH